jgi:hypothetical protein
VIFTFLHSEERKGLDSIYLIDGCYNILEKKRGNAIAWHRSATKPKAM